MQANKTVKINGRLYDAVTGLPIAGTAAAKPAAATPKPTTPATKPAPTHAGSTAAASVHASPQRSKTLHRRATKKPGPAKRPKPGVHMDIARNGAVARFASHPVTTEKPKASSTPDTPHRIHPVAKRAAQKVTKKTRTVQATPKQIKDAAIAKALATPKQTAKKTDDKKRFQWSRNKAILLGLLLVLIGGGIVTYFNLPHLSVALASSQSGVDATYPKYVPDGYGLSQPVTFKDGEVSLKFTSNSGNGEYVINQENSTWDSSAVLENVVRKEVGDNYVTNQERGLKIYIYEGDAAWVSNSILYTVASDAPLSNDQLRRIATGL